MSGQEPRSDLATANNEAVRARFDDVVDLLSGGTARCISARRDSDDPTRMHLEFEHARPLLTVTLTLPPGSIPEG